jgi:hypothetical protein
MNRTHLQENLVSPLSALGADEWFHQLYAIAKRIVDVDALVSFKRLALIEYVSLRPELLSEGPQVLDH